MNKCKCTTSLKYFDAEGRPFNELNKNCLVHSTGIKKKVKYQKINKNKKVSKNSTTGYTGVSFHKTNNKYRVHIRRKGKQIHLGFFAELNDAVNARKIGEKTYN